MFIRPALATIWLVILIASPGLRAADEFRTTALPLLREHCLRCHSTAEKQGELDLQQFDSLERVKQHPAIWQRVLEQITNQEMPPKDRPPLRAEQRRTFLRWIEATLNEIALAQAGDPGPVVLRRLSNAEYTYTVRDLTGVESLDPAREFPVDGAAGEGFTNAGAALVMSPSLLTKYLDAAKEIASHAVLLPDGIRFSPHTTPRDWTDEILVKIRDFYAQFSDSEGATAVNLQGIKFDTNAGGRLPVNRYITALLQQRDDLRAGRTTLLAVAHSQQLNERYLSTLWRALNDDQTSLVLDPIRKQFRESTVTNAPEIIRAIEAWQQSLWRFASVGHIGKLNGPKSWQEPVTPLVPQQELRLKLVPKADGGDIAVYLSTGDAGDGREGDSALWQNPRLVAPGRPDLPLRHVRAAVQQLAQRREQVISNAARCLAAAAEAERANERPPLAELAQRHNVDADILAGWLNYLGIGSPGEVKLGPLLTKKLERTPDYDFIQGWTGADALSVTANSSDAAVRVPGQMKPHSVAAHPAPKVAAVVAWQSPESGPLKITGSVQDAHPECGNGVTWSLEVRRGQAREALASGVSQGATQIQFGPIENIRVQRGDVVALVIGPRDGNHVCDLTAIELVLHNGEHEWSLARDISPNILAGNPHADSHGNPAVWHFCGEPAAVENAPGIPAGSLLATWRRTADPTERQGLAEQIQQLLEQGLTTVTAESPNRELYRQLLSYRGPLLAAALRFDGTPQSDNTMSQYGVDPTLFGKHPQGEPVDPRDLCVHAPAVIEVRLPASLAEGAELVANGKLQSTSGAEGSVQMQLLAQPPGALSGIVASKSETALAPGQWSDNNLRTFYSIPIIVNDGSQARQRFERAFHDFRQLFPAALCYTKIVPVDEVVTLTLFYREDEHLRRLMLDETQQATLDRLWDELQFVSEAPLKQVDVFEQLYQFATQDANPSAFEPLRAPIMQRAAAFKQLQVEVQPPQLQGVLDFATRAWRRPLAASELDELRALYQHLLQQQLLHDAAVRMVLARVLVAPAFLYRGEQAAPGVKSVPVSNWELATRLSYFLTSTAPDDEIRTLAAAGRFHDSDVLRAQTQRLLRDAKVRRLATEFGCQWLHVRDLDTLDEKSERHFPTFASVRGSMLEETTRFFIDLFQNDRSVLSLLDADHTFVDAALAEHYGFPLPGNGWQRVDGLRALGRGGVLGMASTLAKQSGASRTSPILRGNWISEVVLGEKLPRPPKGVPILPEEAPQGLTERQLIERHSAEPKCAKCHQRIDPLGFALEGFDAIGRARQTDAGGLTIETRAKLLDGTEFAGLDGLRNYLVTARRDDFLRQFCRKLLSYALGRSVQLSDKPLLDTMLRELASHDYHVSTAIELIVLSPQFREVRGRDFVSNE
jgi:Protein of unknown function (DUF1592)/Protein of unknown function (DUF1588)/Protein of unknown function (DUF1587)/Protein of unknown function (DUF1585)/Protein of unknown function (DUF1595)/Planctomycete cytochrome C